jgi:sec-independent protein translocase protein TatA
VSLGNLGAHWWVILIIVVLLFGAPKLPALARSMGQSMRIFRSEMKTNKDEKDDENNVAAKTDTSTAPDAGDTAAKP